MLQYSVFWGAVETGKGPVLNEGAIAIGDESVQSPTVMDPMGSNMSRCVRVIADRPCFVTWGHSPTALTDGTGGRMMAAYAVEYFDIPSNQKIAVIAKPAQGVK